jgi:hypothetical protein
MFDIDDDAAQVLLQNCSQKNQFNIRWNKEKLINQYFSNQEKLLEDAGLNHYSATNIQQTLTRVSSKSNEIDKKLKNKSPNETFLCL